MKASMTLFKTAQLFMASSLASIFAQVNIPQPSLGQSTVRQGLQIFFAIAGAVAMLMITIGGLRYVLSRGDSNGIKNAKETIIYAAVGLVVTMTGYGIVTFVLSRI